VPEVVGTNDGRLVSCSFCGELNPAEFAFCASCGLKRRRTKNSLPQVAKASSQRCWSCDQFFMFGIELCPFCGADCRPLEERALTILGQIAATASFLLLALIPIYLYMLPAATKDVDLRAASNKPLVLSGHDGLSSASRSSSVLNRQTDRDMSLSSPTESTAAANVQTEVSAFLDTWISSFQSRNVEQHLAHYAPRLSTYFTWHDVSHRRVEQDKRMFFKAYDQIAVMRIHDVRILRTSMTTAEATFLKDWEVRGQGEFSGKVLQRLLLARFNGRWQITSEEELRTLRRRKVPPAKLRMATFSPERE
jgi:hypothetical protein